jgi:preprotein translocase subunit SecE
MAEKSNTQQPKQDTLKWIVVVAIIAGGIYANAYFAAESVLIRAVGFIALAAVAGWIAAQTTRGSAFVTLCLEARTEIRKVVWPTRQETTQTTIIVLIVVFILALVLWLLDWLLGIIVSGIIG